MLNRMRLQEWIYLVLIAVGVAVAVYYIIDGRAINGVLTLGKGQRVGLMAGSGVGKSVLLGLITRQTVADVVVVG